MLTTIFPEVVYDTIFPHLRLRELYNLRCTSKHCCLLVKDYLRTIYHVPEKEIEVLDFFGYNKNALISCSNKGCSKAVRFLLENGAKVAAHDNLALRLAAMSGHAKVVKLLLRYGADLHAFNDEALRLASERNHVKVAESLLDRGAKVYKRRVVYTPSKAIRRDCTVDAIPTSLSTERNYRCHPPSALVIASSRGYHKIVRAILDRRPEEAAVNSRGKLATSRKNKHGIAEKGADVRFYNNRSFVVAVENGHCETVELLLQFGSDHRALVGAAVNGQQELVRYLLDRRHGEQISIDKPLGEASAYGYDDTVKVLLKHEASIRTEGALESGLIIASMNGHHKVVQLLLQYGVNVHKNHDLPLRNSSVNGHLETVRTLLDWGASVHAYDDEALRAASKNGRDEIVKLLLRHGANVRAKNDMALRRALEKGYYSTVEILLRHGADPYNPEVVTSALQNGHEVLKLLSNR